MKTCRLCGVNKKLIKAHIIPRWAFRYLYPDNLESKKQALVLVGKFREIKRPIGPYDGEILCGECDNFLGNYDAYAKTVLLDAPLKDEAELYYLITNVDIEKLRLFFLSMIWRASVSTREEFNSISIGPYEDRVRKILENAKIQRISSSLQDFSFVVAKFDVGSLPKDVVEKNIQIPYIQKISGVNTATFYMPRGLKIFLKLDQRKFPCNLEKVANFHSKGLIITKLGNYNNSREFRALLSAY